MMLLKTDCVGNTLEIVLQFNSNSNIVRFLNTSKKKSENNVERMLTTIDNQATIILYAKRNIEKLEELMWSNDF